MPVNIQVAAAKGRELVTVGRGRDVHSMPPVTLVGRHMTEEAHMKKGMILSPLVQALWP